MSKADRLRLSITRVKQDLNNLRRNYVILPDINDKPRLREIKLLERLQKLERELKFEERV